MFPSIPCVCSYALAVGGRKSSHALHLQDVQPWDALAPLIHSGLHLLDARELILKEVKEYILETEMLKFYMSCGSRAFIIFFFFENKGFLWNLGSGLLYQVFFQKTPSLFRVFKFLMTIWEFVGFSICVWKVFSLPVWWLFSLDWRVRKQPVGPRRASES